MYSSAELTGDSLLMAKLSLGDMVAYEAKYHTKCLLTLYNRARKVQVNSKEHIVKMMKYQEFYLLNL